MKGEDELFKRMQILKTRLTEDDVIVLRVDKALTKATYDRIKAMILPVFPDNKIVLLDEGMDLGVITKEELVKKLAEDD